MMYMFLVLLLFTLPPTLISGCGGIADGADHGSLWISVQENAGSRLVSHNALNSHWSLCFSVVAV